MAPDIVQNGTHNEPVVPQFGRGLAEPEFGIIEPVPEGQAHPPAVDQRYRQAAAGREFAGQDIGDGMARHTAQLTRVDNAGQFRAADIGIERARSERDKHDAPIDRIERLEQRLLRCGQCAGFAERDNDRPRAAGGFAGHADRHMVRIDQITR